MVRLAREDIAEMGGGSYVIWPDVRRAGLSSGYYVGGRVPSVQCEGSAGGWPAAMSAFLRDNRPALACFPGRVFGVWLDHQTGVLHLDVSDHVADLADALSLAASRGELAIWDIANLREVRVVA